MGQGTRGVEAYNWITIDRPEDYRKLADVIDEEYGPSDVVASLEKSIRDTVRGVLVEQNYIDKDYRSTFYAYYAKKGRKYRDNCVRLHFFDAGVSFDEATSDLFVDGHTVLVGDEYGSSRQLETHYFGFIVLRPTIWATIGRSILSPDIRAGARGQAIQARHRVHVLGHQLSVWGFPSMSQHTDISVCAHVSCWAILRHYSERFVQYRELLLQDITMLATQFDPGGITPGLGLKIYEAERILHAAGTYPLVIAKRRSRNPEFHDDAFYAQLLAYLESGFPVFAVMESQEHAVVLNGYGWLQPPASRDGATSHAWEQVEHFLAVDDNVLPYTCIPFDAAQLPAQDIVPEADTTPALEKGKDRAFAAIDLDGFIVPLPDKIFYPASAVETQSVKFYHLLCKWLPMPATGDLIRRYFITTVSALRHYVRSRRSELGDDLVNMIMLLDTAQFVWIVEYASSSQWNDCHIAARVIVDATASPRDKLPVIFAHGLKTAMRFDRTNATGEPQAVELSRNEKTPLSRMEQNLRPVRQLQRPKDLSKIDGS